MIDLGTYELKYLNTVKIISEESFTNAYIEEIYEWEQLLTYTKLLHTILGTKHEKADLIKQQKINFSN